MRNTFWGVIYRIITLLGPFAIKTIIIKKMGLEYSGLNNLFTSVLTVLNLANLGFSNALVYTMYRAVAEEDNDALCAMLNFYRRAYRIVGLVILGMGLIVMPFLPHLVNGECPPGINLYVLFAIYLAETSFDYLMFGYNVAIFSAYQRGDITMKISTVRYIVQYAVQAAALLLFANYYIYAVILPLMVIPNNIANYIAARKCYPEITCRGSLAPREKKEVYKRVSALFSHKVGSVAMLSIDSVIISAMLGLTPLSLYGNYYYILSAVNSLVEILTEGSMAGIGNKLITDTEEDNYRLFHTLTYGWLALVGGAAACMLCFYQPFIGAIWLGEEYLLSNGLMMLIVFYFYSRMSRLMLQTYHDAAGLWPVDWLKPYIGTLINITGSILMVKYTGSIAGVLVPTMFVYLFVFTPWEAQIVMRTQFHKNAGAYFRKSTRYVLLAAADSLLCYGLCMLLVPENTVVSLMIRGVIVAVLYPSVWLGVTCKTLEFRGLFHIIRHFVRAH